jgi:hypothetical protein
MRPTHLKIDGKAIETLLLHLLTRAGCQICLNACEKILTLEVVHMKLLTIIGLAFAWLLAPPLMAQDPGGPLYTTVPPSLFVPVGTVITVQTRDFLSSETTRAGDGFIAVLQQPVVAQGWVVARPGQTVLGRVTFARQAGRGRAVSELGVELAELSLVDGQQLPVRTQMIENFGSPSGGNEAGTIAAATGVGAVIGAAAGGGRGAAIGAAAGAGAAVAGVLLTRGRPTEIESGSVLTFRLDAPMTVSTDLSQQAFVAVTAADYRVAPDIRIARREREEPRYRRYPVYAPYPVYVERHPVIIVRPRTHVHTRVYTYPDYDHGRTRGRGRSRR